MTSRDLTVVIVTVSGDPWHLELPSYTTGRPTRVADARERCVEHFGWRARMAKLLMGEEVLEDEREIEQFEPRAVEWHLVFLPATRCTLLAGAKQAEEMERHQEALQHLQELPSFGLPLSPEERNCWIRNAKRLLKFSRDAWENSAVEDRQAISDELENLASELLCFLEACDVNDCSEDLVCFNCFRGDVHRYLALMGGLERREQEVQRATDAYEVAKQSMEGLSPLNPVRLGLCLNVSIFYSEVLQDVQNAIKIAKHAFDDAVSFNLGRGEEWETEGFDKALIEQLLCLLRENLTLWTDETPDEPNQLP